MCDLKCSKSDIFLDEAFVETADPVYSLQGTVCGVLFRLLFFNS
jgi:hypothetical protein